MPTPTSALDSFEQIPNVLLYDKRMINNLHHFQVWIALNALTHTKDLNRYVSIAEIASSVGIKRHDRISAKLADLTDWGLAERNDKQRGQRGIKYRSRTPEWYTEYDKENQFILTGKPKPGYTQLMNSAARSPLFYNKPTELFIYVYALSKLNDYGFKITASTLAKHLGKSKTTLYKKLRMLSDAEYIFRFSEKHQRSHREQHYYIAMRSPSDKKVFSKALANQANSNPHA